MTYSEMAAAPQTEERAPSAGRHDELSPNGRAALEYASFGCPVFPVGPDKTPLIRDNLRTATTCPDLIAGWWAKWPAASIGAPAGRASGFIVLDVDVKDGRDGASALAVLEALYGELPYTVKRTGGTGFQLFFKHPEGVRIKNVANQMGAGLDVRGCDAEGNPKGYTRLPAPVGNPYGWEGDGDFNFKCKLFAEAPLWLLYLMIFNAREREQLAAAGIAGPDDFGIAPPSDWQSMVGGRLKASWRERRTRTLALPDSSAPPPPLNVGRLEAYVRKGIESELASIRTAQPGVQEQTLNDAGLKIHGLLKGAAFCGLDVAALTEDTRIVYVAACAMMQNAPGRADWTIDDGQAKWEHTEDDAAPRDLFDIAHPEAAFSPVSTPGAGGLLIDAAAPFVTFPDTAKDGRPMQSIANVRAFLNAGGIEVRRDAFENADYFGRASVFRKMDDGFENAIRIAAETAGLRVPKEQFHWYLIEIARNNSHNPLKEHLRALTWDGVARLDKWLAAYLGADDTALNRAFGRLTLVAAVRRVMQPGCKFDTLLVLEGGQGTGKSTALRLLAGGDRYFTEAVALGDDAKVMIEQTAGKWVVEVAELEGMGKREVETIKSQLSRTSDRARLAYGRTSVEVPRQFIMIGTTNGGEGEAGYLKDPTGNRRFWPVATAKIELGALAADRDQLWAEAVAVEAAGESLFLPPELRDAAKVEQAKRRVHDEIEAELAALLDGARGIVSRTTIFHALGIGAAANRRKHQAAAVKRALVRLGWEEYRPRGGPPGVGDSRPRGWTNDRAGPLLSLDGDRLVPVRNTDGR